MILCGRCVSFGAARWHPHVRRSGAVWVGVRARGCHLLHSTHPDGAPDGGADDSYLALAHGGGRVLQPGLLPGLARLPQWVFWLVVHHDLAFLVEGVRHHAGQLSSSLHNQIPETQVFTTELLQTILMSQTRITCVCFVVLCFSELSIFSTFFTHWSSVTDRRPVEVKEPLEQSKMERN